MLRAKYIMNFKNKYIDVLIPTVRNPNNLSKLISQILSQKGNFKIRVYIVDQYLKNNQLNSILLNSDIKHIKIIKRNLSKAKNLGIYFSKSYFLTFLDDDVLIPNDYFLKSYNFMHDNKVDILFNKILNSKKKPLTLSMTNNILKITNRNWQCCLASAMWVKKSILHKTFFDEKFGIGGLYGSGEETDYLLRSLKKGKKIYYNGKIFLYHPDDNIPLKVIKILQKYKKYGYGQGALLKKFKKEFKTFGIILSIARSLMGVFYSLMCLRFKHAIKYTGLLTGKIKGFIKFA